MTYILERLNTFECKVQRLLYLCQQGTKTENETSVVKPSASALTKTELPVIPEMKVYSEARIIKAGYVWTKLETRESAAG